MTAWITHSPETVEELREGQGEAGLVGWKEKVVKGLVKHMAREGRYGLCAVEPIAAEEEGGMEVGIGRDPFYEAWDEVSGKVLDPEGVRKAQVPR